MNEADEAILRNHEKEYSMELLSDPEVTDNSLLWVEKYTPKQFTELLSDDVSY